MNFKNIFTTDYWFNVDRVGLHLVDKVVFGIGVGFVLVAIILVFVKRRIKNPYDKQLLGKFVNALWITGVVEVLWFGFRYENAIYISTLFVAGFVGLCFLVRLLFLAKDYLKNRKVALQNWQKEQLKNKYLPQQR